MAIASEKPSRWGTQSEYSLTELEAFDAMRVFLEAFWRRDGANKGDSIAKLLSFTDRTPWPSEKQLPHLANAPLDIAQWDDWLDAIGTIKGKASLQP
jgi:hypothetical protein